MTITVHHGDNLEILRGMASASIDAVITDPPYALVSITRRFGADGAAPARGGVYARGAAGFMGQRWDTGERAFAAEFWAEILRVLKPGAHLAAFGGTRTYHRLACAIEDAGFDIRDQLGWAYGTGFPKSHDVAQAIDRPAAVDIPVKGGGGGRIHTYGDGLNVGWAARSPHRPLSDDARRWAGWGTALKPAWEPICLARAPLAGTVAKTVLAHGTGALNIDGCRVDDPDGRPIERMDHFDTGGRRGYGGGLTGGRRAETPNRRGRWPANIAHDGSPEAMAGLGGGARFFYSAKAGVADRLGSAHPTVKPVDLMAWLCRMITPPGGCVLDPFAGSGTTGGAAQREGFSAVLIEREAAYVTDIRRRLAHAGGGGSPLFGIEEDGA